MVLDILNLFLLLIWRLHRLTSVMTEHGGGVDMIASLSLSLCHIYIYIIANQLSNNSNYGEVNG